ncbi:hypothetical protein F4774DRAFT_13964 [Daldinia eschscholtzii]|nr:hypothetical protein F4774DRAFT_13964 [Daldinia eschscholtzii]
MSIDLDNPSSENVARLTKLLSRRPEYGIAIPSRRWLNRQEEKLRNIPEELLNNSGLLKRLFMKIADRIDPELVDPRAVLCKTHSALNPWLIRRFFLAVAYEVTVHTDVLRSWKGRMNYPVLSGFVGRVDSIAALWTQPDLYCECYGTPPFESHLIYVQSGCEACILSAMGANARVLADLRTTLIDRVERRPLRPSRRRAREPKLKRYVDEWISQLTEERAAKCIAMSDSVLEELRNVRPQLKEWRAQRRKKRSKNKTVYTELKKTSDGGTELKHVTENRRYKRRTKNGIPVAVADLEGAEDQRRAALYSLKDNVKSVYRPDSLSPYSEFGGRYEPSTEEDPLLPINEGEVLSDDYEDPEDFDELDELEDHPDLDRDFEAEERSRQKVSQWYSSQVLKLELTPDDTKSVLSMAHPAFRPPVEFSHISAAPSPLNIKKNRSRRTLPARATDSVWTDVTVYTTDNRTTNRKGDAPSLPRVPSKYKQDNLSRNNGSERPSRARSPLVRPATALGHRSTQNVRQSAGSSVYSTERARQDGTGTGTGFMKRFLTGESEVTRGTRPRHNNVSGNNRDTQGYTAVLPHRSRFFTSALDLPELDGRDYRSNRSRSQSHGRSREGDTSHRRSQSQDHSGGRASHSRNSSTRHVQERRGNRSHGRGRSTTATTTAATATTNAATATNATAASTVTMGGSRTASSRTLVTSSPSEEEDRAWKDSWGIRPEDEDDGLGPEDSHSVAFWREDR